MQSYHFAMHTLERALFAYAETRNAAAQRSAARVAHPKTGDKKLFRHPTDPASVANVEEKDNAAEPQVVNVSNFITLPVTGESSPTATWDHSALADEDSDDAGGNKSDNMTREVLSVRNSRFMEKHRIQVGASAKAPKGQGLFAKEKWRWARSCLRKGHGFTACQSCRSGWAHCPQGAPLPCFWNGWCKCRSQRSP